MSTKIYKSPSTDNLLVDFRAYIIELVCLNIDNNLGERFWKTKTWALKFRREIGGFSRWIKDHTDYKDNEIKRKAMIYSIKKIKCKSMLSSRTRHILNKHVRDFIAMCESHKSTDFEFDAEQNAKIVETGHKLKISKLRAIENNG